MGAFGSEAAVLQALRARYEAPAWAFLRHVRNGTGYQRAARTADAVAMSLWPSRGLELHGFEVKVSRSDWLKELEDPAKAEKVFRFCDRWWLAVGDEKIVQPGELPPTWGLLVPRGAKLVAKVEAPTLTPEPLTRLFLASLLRNVSEAAPDKVAIEAAVAATRKEERDHHAKSFEADRKAARGELDHLQQAVKEFEAKSGLHIGAWNAGELGEAVRTLLAADKGHLRSQLDLARAQAQAVADRAKAALEELAKLAEAN